MDYAKFDINLILSWRKLTKYVIMNTVLLIVAIVAFVLGIGINYWINRRKFYRRNVAGLEGFSSDVLLLLFLGRLCYKKRRSNKHDLFDKM